MDHRSPQTHQHRQQHLHRHDQYQRRDQEHGQRAPVRQPWRDIHSPQAHINYWLKLAETRFSTTFGRELKEWDLIASEWAALRELYRPTPLSALDVGRALGMSKGGASKLIDRLVDKGLVEKKIVQSDRRFRAVSLTPSGRAIVPSLAQAEVTTHGQFFRLLHPKERVGLMLALQRTLGAENKDYMDQWISIDGGGGQWVFQAAWHRSVRREPLSRPTFSGSEQSLQLFGGQLTELPSG
jgi:DNA-binding MarR family transcriptional regulator